MTKEQYYSMHRLSANCTWGFAEDICVFDNWDKSLTIGMSWRQAEKLIEELQCAIDECKRLEAMLERDMNG